MLQVQGHDYKKSEHVRLQIKLNKDIEPFESISV